MQDSYANGVLTVTDGSNTAELSFSGSYTLANFDFASDGSGGTIVYDPPAPTSLQPERNCSRRDFDRPIRISNYWDGSDARARSRQCRIGYVHRLDGNINP